MPDEELLWQHHTRTCFVVHGGNDVRHPAQASTSIVLVGVFQNKMQGHIMHAFGVPRWREVGITPHPQCPTDWLCENRMQATLCMPIGVPRQRVVVPTAFTHSLLTTEVKMFVIQHRQWPFVRGQNVGRILHISLCCQIKSWFCHITPTHVLLSTEVRMFVIQHKQAQSFFWLVCSRARCRATLCMDLVFPDGGKLASHHPTMSN